MLEKETLKLSKKVLEEYHPDTLMSMGSLALIYKELGWLGGSRDARERDTQALQESAWRISS